MKRKVCISLVLALCLMLSVSAVASAAEFHYSFNSEVGTQDSNIGTRTKANGTDWDITITSGSLSSTISWVSGHAGTQRMLRSERIRHTNRLAHGDANIRSL